MSEDHNAFGRIAILLALTLVASSLSWHCLEQPFLAWKNGMVSGRKRIPEAAREVSFAPQTYNLNSTPAPLA